MRRVYTLSVILLLTVISGACERLEDEFPILSSGDLSFTQSQAKRWFLSSVNKARTNKNDSISVYQWSKSHFINFKFGKSLVIPIEYKNYYKPKLSYGKNAAEKKEPKYNSTYNDLNFLIIFKDKNGEFVSRLLRILPDEDYLIKTNDRKISSPFDGVTLLESIEGKLVEGLVYKNGKVIGSSKSSKKARPGEIDYCVTEYTFACWETPEGLIYGCTLISSQILFCYTIGGSDSNGSSNDDNGTGDYAGGDILRIRNLLSNECFKSSLDKVTSTHTKNMISSIICNYESSPKYNVTITEGDLGDCQNDAPNGQFANGIVTLNNNGLRFARQEAIVSTLIHEIIHANLSGGNEIEHDIMATQKYIRPFTEILQSIFPNLSYEHATALAWTGLEHTNAFQQFYGDGTYNARMIMNTYRRCNNLDYENLGTPCN